MSTNPFLTVWTRPTATAEQMLHSKKALITFAILIIAGLSSVLSQLPGNNSFELPLAVILLGSLILGPVVQIAGHAIASLLYWLIGKILKGTGTFSDVFHATSISYIPSILSLIPALLGVVLYGDLFFMDTGMYTVAPEVSTGFLIYSAVAGLFSTGMLIWGLVILCKAIGVAHRFSVYKGLAVTAIVLGTSFILIAVITFLLIAVAVAFTS